MKTFILTTVFFFCILTLGYSQEIAAPAEGKCVVYFVRVSSLGFAINFSYFDKDKFIGKFNGPKYMRYECEPGEHLFWAHSENFDFITAELEAGKIYFIEAMPQMGVIKAGVHLEPVDPKNSKRLTKIENLINKKSPETYTESELEAENKNLQDLIAKGLERYQKDLEKGKKIERLEKDMFYQK